MSRRTIGNPILRQLRERLEGVVKDLADGTTAEAMLAQVQESQAVTHDRLERIEEKLDRVLENE